MKSIIEPFARLQGKIEEKTRYIGKGKYGRVLKMARKPDTEEFMQVSKITTIGILLVGGMGFLIFWLWVNVPKFFSDLLGL